MPWYITHHAGIDWVGYYLTAWTIAMMLVGLCALAWGIDFFMSQPSEKSTTPEDQESESE